MTAFKFACDSMMESQGVIIAKQPTLKGTTRLLIRGTGPDNGYFFVKHGDHARRYSNLKLATDALVGRDAGLPDAHQPGKHYDDGIGTKADISHTAGVGAGLDEEQANVHTVEGPTGAVVTRQQTREDTDKEKGVDSYSPKIGVGADEFSETEENQHPKNVENVVSSPGGERQGQDDEFNERY